MSKNLNDILIRQFVSEELARLNDERPAAAFLDIGCGDLRHAVHSNFPGWWRVFGDYDSRSGSLTLRLDAQRLPFAANSFDIVLLTEVIEHLPEPSSALSEISRVLRPGGILVLTAPFLWGTHEAPHDYQRLTEFGLAQAVTQARLELVTVQRRGDLIGVILSAVQFLLAGLAEYARRKRLLWPIWALHAVIIAPLGRSILAAYVAIFGQRIRLRYVAAGVGLRGPSGHLNAWPLGFNLVCRKPAS